MIEILRVVLLFLLVLSEAHAALYSQEFIITRGFRSNDRDRSIISINNVTNTIGPTLSFRSGDRVNLLVHNLLNDDTAIHFHGLIMENHAVDEGGLGNLYDGVPGVTQFPIKPNYSFLYNFTLPPSSCGTFWYHSHHSVQYGEGLRGVVTVGCDEYDNHIKSITGDSKVEEQIITLSDWYSVDHEKLLQDLLERFGGTDPRVDGSLFNGEERDGVKIAIEDPQTTKYLLLRVVNMAMSSTQVLHIENHDLVIVETDGILVKPFRTQSLSLAVGQRYTILLELQSHMKNSRIIHGSNKMMGYIQKTHWLVYDPTQTLSSKSADVNIDHLPGFTSREFYDAIEPSDLPTLRGPTHHLSLDYYFQHDEATVAKYNTGMYMVNEDTMSQFIPEGEKALIIGNRNIKDPILLPLNATVELAINSIDHMTHPWHMHGHTFQVISIGPRSVGKLDWEVHDSPAMQAYNSDLENWRASGKTPMTRDSINIPGSSYAVIRFTTNNPGFWLLHCHVDWHMAKGLGVVFQEGDTKLDTFNYPTPFPSPERLKALKLPAGINNTTTDTADTIEGNEVLQGVSETTSKMKVLIVYALIMCVLNYLSYKYIT